MKRSTTQTVSKKFAVQASAVAAAVLIAGVAFLQVGTTVFARDFDAEIRAKEREAQQYQQEANRLAGEADTLQRELGILNSQIGQLRAEIAANQEKHDKLVKDIEEKKKLIAQNREVLGDILADLYISETDG